MTEQIILDHKKVQLFLLKKIFEQECIKPIDDWDYKIAFWTWLHSKGLMEDIELERLLKGIG